MCDFVSAVKKDGNLYFLTGDQVFRSERGRTCRETSGFQAPDDWTGHGFIRLFYGNLQGGNDVEFTDFSSPSNFPMPIRLAILNGEMRGFPMLSGLLIAPIWQKAAAELAPIRQKADAEVAAIQQKRDAEVAAIWQKADAELAAIHNNLWLLFADPANRAEAWR